MILSGLSSDETALERFNIAKPLYRQIERILRQSIDAGAGRLQPERILAQRFGVSRMTIRAALLALEQDRLITRRVGRGTEVVRPA
jgi:DNA-binding GntR family transcriptional regulator